MVQACEACEACEGVDWAHFLQVAFQVLDSNGKNTEPIGPSGPSGPGSTIRLASKIMIVAAPVLILAAFVLASFHTSKRLEHEEKPERGMSFGMLILLASTLCLDFFCTDQYQPSMPDMAKEFWCVRCGYGCDDPNSPVHLSRLHVVSRAFVGFHRPPHHYSVLPGAACCKHFLLRMC